MAIPATSAGSGVLVAPRGCGQRPAACDTPERHRRWRQPPATLPQDRGAASATPWSLRPGAWSQAGCVRKARGNEHPGGRGPTVWGPGSGATCPYVLCGPPVQGLGGVIRVGRRGCVTGWGVGRRPRTSPKPYVGPDPNAWQACGRRAWGGGREDPTENHPFTSSIVWITGYIF